MRFDDVVSNVNIYGLEESVKGAKYSMATDLDKITTEITKTTYRLASSPTGSGHDNFLNGIIVQFDLTFSNKVWVEAERYHFLDFVSSQSTMHRITKFNLDDAYISYTDPRIIEIMKEKTKEYNDLQEDIKRLVEEGKDVSSIHDYASRVYIHTHAEMYKFTKGKFKTYFIAGTNCVNLADDLIRSKDLNLIDLNGLVTPGAYLAFLNTEYLKKDSIVKTRTLYESETLKNI